MVETPAADAKTNCDLPTETPDENPAEEANPTDTVDDLSELENRISVLEELVAKLQDSLMLMTEATTEMDNQIAEFAKQTAVESVTLSKQTPREPLPFEKFLSQRNKI